MPSVLTLQVVFFKKEGKRDLALEEIVHDAMDEVADYFSISKNYYAKKRPKVYVDEKLLDIYKVDGLANHKKVYLKKEPKLEVVYEEATHCLDITLCHPKIYFQTHKYLFNSILLEAFGYYGSKIGLRNRFVNITSGTNELLAYTGAYKESVIQAVAELKYLKNLTLFVAYDKAEASKRLKELHKNVAMLRTGMTHALGYDLGHYAFEVIEERRLESRDLAKEMMIINRKKTDPLEKYVEIANIVYSKSLI